MAVASFGHFAILQVWLAQAWDVENNGHEELHAPQHRLCIFELGRAALQRIPKA
jgi:hypothetical protein